MKLDELGDDPLNEIIRKLESGKYRLYSHSGKNLGTYDTHAGAEKRERQVQAFKHMGEDVAGVPLPKNYNPDSETYRYTTSGGRIPNSKSISSRDITAKGQRTKLPNISYTPDSLANINKDELSSAIYSALDNMPKREAIVLKARFGLDPFTKEMTLQEIAKVLGVSDTRIKQIEDKALRRLSQTQGTGSIFKKSKVRSRTLRDLMYDNANTIGRIIDEAPQQEQQPLPTDLNKIGNLIDKLENKGVSPEDADKIRRAIQSLASSRQSIYPESILQLLTILAG